MNFLQRKAGVGAVTRHPRLFLDFSVRARVTIPGRYSTLQTLHIASRRCPGIEPKLEKITVCKKKIQWRPGT